MWNDNSIPALKKVEVQITLHNYHFFPTEITKYFLYTVID